MRGGRWRPQRLRASPRTVFSPLGWDRGYLRGAGCWRHWRGSRLCGEPAFSLVWAAGGSCGLSARSQVPSEIRSVRRRGSQPRLLPQAAPCVERPRFPEVSAALLHPALWPLTPRALAPWPPARPAPLSSRPGVPLPGARGPELAAADPLAPRPVPSDWRTSTFCGVPPPSRPPCLDN